MTTRRNSAGSYKITYTSNGLDVVASLYKTSFGWTYHTSVNGCTERGCGDVFKTKKQAMNEINRDISVGWKYSEVCFCYTLDM